MQTWQMQGAKARMSELIKCAQSQPQDITVHGKSVAVVVSRETFERLTQTQDSLLEFMRRSPLYEGDEIVLERANFTGRHRDRARFGTGDPQRQRLYRAAS